MATQCFRPLRGKRIRLTALDVCGRYPDPGAENAQAVTNGYVTVTLTSEVEDGTEIFTRLADGNVCVNEMFAPTFKRFNVEIEFCGVDPGVLALTTNAEVYQDYAGDDAGITVPEGTVDGLFAFEIWTGLAGAVCASGDEEASGYMLLPMVNAGVLGDIEVTEDNAVTFSMTGGFTKGGNAWGVGPYDVVSDSGTPSPLPTPLDPFDHLLIMLTGVAPPPAACGLQAMPA